MQSIFSIQTIQRVSRTWHLLLVTIVLLNFSLSLGGACITKSKESRQTRNVNGDSENPIDYSCYDLFGKPHKGLMPHPSCCNYYIVCLETDSGTPVPRLEYCASDLLFDMNKCECVSPTGSELCFDSNHEPIRFQCAEPILKKS